MKYLQDQTSSFFVLRHPQTFLKRHDKFEEEEKVCFFGITNSPLQLYTVSLYCNCQVWRKENYGEHIHPFPVLIKTLSPHHVGIVIVLLLKALWCGELC